MGLNTLIQKSKLSSVGAVKCVIKELMCKKVSKEIVVFLRASWILRALRMCLITVGCLPLKVVQLARKISSGTPPP